MANILRIPLCFEKAKCLILFIYLSDGDPQDARVENPCGSVGAHFAHEFETSGPSHRMLLHLLPEIKFFRLDILSHISKFQNLLIIILMY